MTKPSKFRKENAKLMMPFSTYEEYQEYLYDFYERDWSSIQQNFGEDSISTLDECWEQYFAEQNHCYDFCEDSSTDNDYQPFEGQEEEPYMKNRALRSQRRKKSAYHRKHDENIAFILGKKSDKENRKGKKLSAIIARKEWYSKAKRIAKQKLANSCEGRPSATLYKRSKVALIIEESSQDGYEHEIGDELLCNMYSIKLLEHTTRKPKCYGKRVITWNKRVNRLHRNESKNPSSISEEALIDSLETGTTYVSEEHYLYFNRMVQIATYGSSVNCKVISPLKVSKEVPVLTKADIIPPCIVPFLHVKQSFLENN